LPYTNTRKGNEMRRYSIEPYAESFFSEAHLNIEEDEGGEWVKASDAIVEMSVSETDLLNKIADLMIERDDLIDEKSWLVAQLAAAKRLVSCWSPGGSQESLGERELKRHLKDLLSNAPDCTRDRENVELTKKCQEKNTTIGTVYDMLGGELPCGQKHHSRDQVMEYIAERENFD